MSLSTAIRHNQSFFVAAIISILAFGGMFACHLTETQKKQIISTAAIAAETTATGQPLPWSRIGLAIGTLLGSGTMVDNRRKDILIKRLKTENANALAIVAKLAAPANNNPSRVPPLCNN